MCHSQWIAPSGKWKSMIWHQDTGSWLLTLGHLAPWYGHQVSHNCHLNGSAESVNRNLHSVKFTHWNPWDPALVWLKSILRLQLSTFRSSGLNLATSSSTSHLDSVVSSFTTSHSLRPLSGHWFYIFVKTVAAFLSSSPFFTLVSNHTKVVLTYRCNCQSSASFSCDLQAEPNLAPRACSVMANWKALIIINGSPERSIGIVHVRLHLRHAFLKLLQDILKHTLHWKERYKKLPQF